MKADVTAKVAMEEIERKTNHLMKDVEERDHKIVVLRVKILQTCEIVESSQTLIVKAQ